MFGLFGFYYVCLHLTIYLWLEQSFSVAEMIKDIVERPYITVGFIAFVLLIPLVITSTNTIGIRLEGTNWRSVHRPAYLAAGAGALHFIWLVKAALPEPLIYLPILIILMALRFPPVVRFLQATRAKTWPTKTSATKTSNCSESR